MQIGSGWKWCFYHSIRVKNLNLKFQLIKHNNQTLFEKLHFQRKYSWAHNLGDLFTHSGGFAMTIIVPGYFWQILGTHANLGTHQLFFVCKGILCLRVFMEHQLKNSCIFFPAISNARYKNREICCRRSWQWVGRSSCLNKVMSTMYVCVHTDDIYDREIAILTLKFPMDVSLWCSTWLLLSLQKSQRSHLKKVEAFTGSILGAISWWCIFPLWIFILFCVTDTKLVQWQLALL